MSIKEEIRAISIALLLRSDSRLVWVLTAVLRPMK